MAENLTAAEIRARAQAYKLKTETVHVKEWGTDVQLRELSGPQFVYVTEKAVNKDGTVSQARFICETLVQTLLDMNGERIFKSGDDELLTTGIISQLGPMVMQLNDIGDGAPDPKK